MVQNNQTNNRSNAIDSYYSNPNNATMTGIANTNKYVPIDARTFLPSIGLPPIESNAITPTSPTPNNILFSNMNEALEYANRVRQWNREDTDYTVKQGRENIQWANNLNRGNLVFDSDLKYKDSLRTDKLERRRAIFDKDLAYKDNVRGDKLERDRASWDAKQEAEKTRQADLAKQYNDIWTTNLKTNQDTLANFGKANQNYNDQVHLQRTRELELDRTRIDNENERNKHRNEMEKNNALYRNNIDVTRINADAQLGVARTNADAQSEVARMNNEYGMQNTLLQGSQRQAELDRQGFIQLQLADIDRGQRGYDNMYSMLNQYTNRPRSNFAYWG